MDLQSPPKRSVKDQLYRGRLFAAEQALSDARDALSNGTDPCLPLRQAAEIFQAAHWTSAMRFNGALLEVGSQFAPSFQDSDNPDPLTSTLTPTLSIETFREIISDFLEAVRYEALQEFAWSSRLVEHYSTLCTCQLHSIALFVEECAGAGRVMPLTIFRTSYTDKELCAGLTRLRTRYERALFALLSETPEDSPLDTAAQEELDACLSVWLAPEGSELLSYDIGRLVQAWIQVQRAIRQSNAGASNAIMRLFNAQMRRVYALLNPLWMIHALDKSSSKKHGKANKALYSMGKEWIFVMPTACVHALVISLWGMFLVYRTQAEVSQEDRGQIAELLAEYGITVSSKGIEPQDADQDKKEAVVSSEALAWWEHIGFNQPKRIGELDLSQDAHHRLKMRSQAINKELSPILQSTGNVKDMPANNRGLIAIQVDYLADLAYTLGLGDVAFFAEQLGMVWRYHAFWESKLRSDQLLQALMQTGDPTKKSASLSTEKTSKGKHVECSVIQKTTLEAAQTMLIDLTHCLMQGLNMLSDGHLPPSLTQAHQKVWATVAKMNPFK